MSLRQLHARLKRLEDRIPKPAHSLATDEERQARAQELGQKWWRNSISDPITVAERRDINYLKKHYPQFAPPAPPDPAADALAAIDRYFASEPDERKRAQRQEWLDKFIDSLKKTDEQRARLREERQKAAAAAPTSSATGVEEKAALEKHTHIAEEDERLRLRQLERQKKAATSARARSEDDASSCPDTARAEESPRLRQVKAEVPTTRPRIINDDNDVDWESIDDDD
jgi:hypothetical protein